jgi:hypothetical protein
MRWIVTTWTSVPFLPEDPDIGLEELHPVFQTGVPVS